MAESRAMQSDVRSAEVWKRLQLKENIGINPPVPEKLKMVILGKTGVGKSETGNMILGKKAFTVSPLGASATEHCKSGEADIEIDGQTCNVKVIDTPGLFDTAKTKDEIILELTNIFTLFPDGIDVFAILIPGKRMTEEEKKTVEILTKNFGKPLLRHAILIVTEPSFGIKTDTHTLQDFISSVDALKKLCTELGNRVISSTLDEVVSEETQQGIIKLAFKCRDDNHKKLYTNNLFQEAQKIMAEEEKQLASQQKRELDHLKERRTKAIESCRKRMSAVLDELAIGVSIQNEKQKETIQKHAMPKLREIADEYGDLRVLDPVTDKEIEDIVKEALEAHQIDAAKSEMEKYVRKELHERRWKDLSMQGLATMAKTMSKNCPENLIDILGRESIEIHVREPLGRFIGDEAFIIGLNDTQRILGVEEDKLEKDLFESFKRNLLKMNFNETNKDDQRRAKEELRTRIQGTPAESKLKRLLELTSDVETFDSVFEDYFSKNIDSFAELKNRIGRDCLKAISEGDAAYNMFTSILEHPDDLENIVNRQLKMVTSSSEQKYDDWDKEIGRVAIMKQAQKMKITIEGIGSYISMVLSRDFRSPDEENETWHDDISKDFPHLEICKSKKAEFIEKVVRADNELLRRRCLFVLKEEITEDKDNKNRVKGSDELISIIVRGMKTKFVPILSEADLTKKVKGWLKKNKTWMNHLSEIRKSIIESTEVEILEKGDPEQIDTILKRYNNWATLVTKDDKERLRRFEGFLNDLNTIILRHMEEYVPKFMKADLGTIVTFMKSNVIGGGVLKIKRDLWKKFLDAVWDDLQEETREALRGKERLENYIKPILDIRLNSHSKIMSVIWGLTTTAGTAVSSLFSAAFAAVAVEELGIATTIFGLGMGSVAPVGAAVGATALSLGLIKKLRERKITFKIIDG